MKHISSGWTFFELESNISKNEVRRLLHKDCFHIKKTIIATRKNLENLMKILLCYVTMYFSCSSKILMKIP